MKPKYKILIFLLIIGIIFGVVYYVWNRISEPTIVFPEQTATSTFPSGTGRVVSPTVIESVQGGIKTKFSKISDQEALFSWINSFDELLYIARTGEIYIAKDGTDEKISDRTFDALNSVQISPDYTKILVSFGNPLAPQFQIFDSIDKTWEPLLPEDISYATWGKNSDELVSLSKTTEGITNLSFLDLSKPTPVPTIIMKNFGFLDVTLHFVAPQTLFIIEKPAASYTGSIWKLDTKTLTLETIKDKKRGLFTLWSPDNSFAFAFQNPAIFEIQDAKTLNGSFPIPFKTISSKCSMRGTFGFCFIPQNKQLDSADFIFPDDYLMKKVFTSDDLFMIDSSQENFSSILLGNTGNIPVLDATYPSQNSYGNTVTFLNRYDNFVYKIELEAAGTESNTSTQDQTPVEPTPPGL